MRELADYYNKWKGTAFKLCLGIWVVLIAIGYFLNSNAFYLECKNLVVSHIAGFLKLEEQFVGYFLTLFFDFLAPTSITAGIYFFVLKYVNEKGWKKKYPQYDIDGEWSDTTTYSKRLDSNGWTELKDTKIPSPVIFKQTCKTIEVRSSIGEKFIWYSLLADWDDRGAIRIFYMVEYTAELQRQGYPESRRGYEQMTIDRSGLMPNQKPNKMVGKFWHCLASDGKPIFMGDVIYTRETSPNV
ncbi:MAG: hypothetical protein IJB17_01820 [Oscillospiraceae bacterium]|nr:hypothetical protein [Oscillospiraceae bacterium]